MQHIIYGLPQLRTTIYIADLVARDCDWNHRSPGLGTKKGWEGEQLSNHQTSKKPGLLQGENKWIPHFRKTEIGPVLHHF